MSGQSDLSTLLGTMAPELHRDDFAISTIRREPEPAEVAETWGLVREREGVTLILPCSSADRLGLHYQDRWSLISLSVHSDLAAVGFLAAIAQKLAESSIPCNAVAGYYHDHLLVPLGDAERAMTALRELSGQ